MMDLIKLLDVKEIYSWITTPGEYCCEIFDPERASRLSVTRDHPSGESQVSYHSLGKITYLGPV